jgi:hypothetical protein
MAQSFHTGPFTATHGSTLLRKLQNLLLIIYNFNFSSCFSHSKAVISKQKVLGILAYETFTS